MKTLVRKFVFIIIILTSCPSYSQSIGQYKLNDELNGPAGRGSVWTFDIGNMDSNSQYVTYTAYKNGDFNTKLYRVPIGDGVPIVLSEATEDVDPHHQITPDNQNVVYIPQALRIPDPSVNALSIVALEGGQPIKLNNTGTGWNVNNVGISQDGQWVIFSEQPTSFSSNEIYSIPINGGSAVPLTGSVGDNRLDGYQISPDSQYVIYESDKDSENTMELYSVPINGGPSVKLSTSVDFLGADADITEDTNGKGRFIISPDSKRVIFKSRRSIIFELFSVPIRGGIATKLNHDLIAEDPHEDSIRDFQISADGQYAVYRHERGDSINDLYSTSINGGNPIILNAETEPVSVVFWNGRTSAEISANSKRVIYVGANSNDLYSVDISGGPIIKLSSNTSVSQYRISPDNQRVIYRGRQDNPMSMELFSVPIEGGKSIKLNPDFVDRMNVGGFDLKLFRKPGYIISADSKQVAYISDQDVTGIENIYVVPIAGGTATKLSSNMRDETVFRRFQISKDSAFLVYLADQAESGRIELFGANIQVRKNQKGELCLPIAATTGGSALACL